MIGTDVESEGTSTIMTSRSINTGGHKSSSGLVQRRSLPTTSITIRQMNIIKEDSVEK